MSVINFPITTRIECPAATRRGSPVLVHPSIWLNLLSVERLQRLTGCVIVPDAKGRAILAQRAPVIPLREAASVAREPISY